jgi:hypothetical protein
MLPQWLEFTHFLVKPNQLTQNIQGVSKKCTPFQIQISHNLLNIRCSELAHFISYADLNNA